MSRMQIGKTIHAWGIELSGFGRPFGIATDGDGRLLVTDMDRHLVLRFDPELRTVQWHDGVHGWSDPAPISLEGRLAASRVEPRGWAGPHCVEVDPHSGMTYVTAYYNPLIYALDARGKVTRTIGEGILAGPATALLDRRGRLLVAEYKKSAVLFFDVGGRLLGEAEPSGFDRPHMARPLPDGGFVVADTWNDRLLRFGPEDGLIDASEPVSRPVAVDTGEECLLVTAWGAHRLERFSATGRRLGIVESPALDRPYDARFIGPDIVVADSHHGRVLVLHGAGHA
jgi:hypothetical protein